MRLRQYAEESTADAKRSNLPSKRGISSTDIWKRLTRKPSSGSGKDELTSRNPLGFPLYARYLLKKDSKSSSLVKKKMCSKTQTSLWNRVNRPLPTPASSQRDWSILSNSRSRVSRVSRVSQIPHHSETSPCQEYKPCQTRMFNRRGKLSSTTRKLAKLLQQRSRITLKL